MMYTSKHIIKYCKCTKNTVSNFVDHGLIIPRETNRRQGKAHKFSNLNVLEFKIALFLIEKYGLTYHTIKNIITSLSNSDIESIPFFNDSSARLYEVHPTLNLVIVGACLVAGNRYGLQGSFHATHLHLGIGEVYEIGF